VGRLHAARRSYTVPTVALRGGVEDILSRGGTGSAGAPEEDLAWNVGVRASIPLHQGGARRAEVHQSQKVLAQLALERDGIEQLVIQRIRDAVVRTSASYPALSLSRQAADAARAHYDACAADYASGGCALVPLLDAQESALARELEASRALYRFLADWMGVARSVGRFDFFMDPAEREAWFERAQSWMDRAGR